MTDSTVLFETRGPVALITLNRPQALNSFTRAMHEALWQAFAKIDADKSIRAAVITGSGRGFCAGADLAEFDFTPGPDLVKRADPGPIIEQAFNPSVRKLQALRVPTIAAVNGAAAGAGVSLAMSCDLAIAASNASFTLAFSKIGLVPDAGGTWFLIKKLGLARAMGAAMLSDKLSAKDAKEWGMIWDVAAEGQDCVDAAMQLAQRLAAMPTRALVETRRLLRAAASNELDKQLDLERDTQSALGATHDYIEGVMAFREKRAPKFKGESAAMTTDTRTSDERALAARVGEAMFAGDRASKDFMQMELVSCEPGRAVMRMKVREAMLNGHDICHGGLIFTLADSTFAFACNSRNHVTVAAGCSIEFLRTGRLGDVLTCEGVEQFQQGRHGIYDMRVTNQDGEVVALFRGKSTQVKGTVIPVEEPRS